MGAPCIEKIRMEGWRDGGMQGTGPALAPRDSAQETSAQVYNFVRRWLRGGAAPMPFLGELAFVFSGQADS